ncbi:MAG TPA: hypothetical protein DEP11_05185, partial [Candidatus Jacksonbacteria bacterium]|nr:hypothetical protein [Candidatus Jacksonbacteria bacterium]
MNKTKIKYTSTLSFHILLIIIIGFFFLFSSKDFLSSQTTKATTSASETYRFSPGGKILYKEGVGEYEYKDPRNPHAPTRAGDTVYTYDGVGSR